MNSYSIAIVFPPFDRQHKAAKLLHVLAGCLLIMNAYASYRQQTIDLSFLVPQMASALLILAYAVAGRHLFAQNKTTHRLFRLLAVSMFLYASYYFNQLHLGFAALLQAITALGLFVLVIGEKSIFNATCIVLTEQGITLPSNFKKNEIRWKHVQNMIVKSDFVSIDTIHNQFLQFEINEVMSDEKIDEINAFCRAHFIEHK